MSLGNEERRPSNEAAHETPTKKSSPKATALDALDAIHHAWLAGYDQGLAHGQRMAVGHLAHELLHRQAAEITDAAVQSARQRHGDGWADLVREQAEVVG